MNFSYNLLNLPPEVIYWAGANAKIKYYYTFDGEKLRKTVENNGIVTKVDYCGPGACPDLQNIMNFELDFVSRGLRNGKRCTFFKILCDARRLGL